MSPDKLVEMANQIGAFFATQRKIEASQAIADHMRKFWDPRMRDQIKAHLESGGAGLDPHTREAVRRL